MMFSFFSACNFFKNFKEESFLLTWGFLDLFLDLGSFLEFLGFLLLVASWVSTPRLDKKLDTVFTSCCSNSSLPRTSDSRKDSWESPFLKQRTVLGVADWSLKGTIVEASVLVLQVTMKAEEVLGRVVLELLDEGDATLDAGFKDKFSL